MNNNFTKADLKDGMVVTMRDGTSHYVVRNAAEIQELAEGLSNWDIGVFNDNLKHELKSVHDTVTGYDIMKVSYMGETLWERKEYVSFDVARKSGKRIRYCGENSLIEMKKFKSVSGVLVDLSGYCFEHINQFLDDVKWEIEE